jgi:hypothetical protein
VSDGWFPASGDGWFSAVVGLFDGSPSASEAAVSLEVSLALEAAGSVWASVVLSVLLSAAAPEPSADLADSAGVCCSELLSSTGSADSAAEVVWFDVSDGLDSAEPSAAAPSD